MAGLNKTLVKLLFYSMIQMTRVFYAISYFCLFFVGSLTVRLTVKPATWKPKLMLLVVGAFIDDCFDALPK
jgi:hypothetical protein